MFRVERLRVYWLKFFLSRLGVKCSRAFCVGESFVFTASPHGSMYIYGVSTLALNYIEIPSRPTYIM